MRNAFNKIIDIVGVWGGWAPPSLLLGAPLDLNPALSARQLLNDPQQK